MTWLLILFCFLGCAHERLRSYSYCIVTDVQTKTTDHDVVGWLAHCDDDSVVVFSRMIQRGDGVYYTPYFEGDDPITKYGHIKRIDEIVP